MQHGVVNFLKPPGMTSHDAVSFVRRLAGTKRVGHTGTLDPAAAGALPICVGQATRLVEYLQAGRKTYLAELTFGTETDTLDAVGNVVSEGDASGVNVESLRAVLDNFRGAISQTPPLFSAIKIDGKKLYELAREGVEESDIEIAAREVEIFSLVVTRFFASSATSSTRCVEKPRAMLRVECGSGTYIRSLVRDIGRALGCGATMTFLVRTQNGAFDIENAHTPESLQRDFTAAMMPIEQAFSVCTDSIIEDDEAIERLSKGQNVICGAAISHGQRVAFSHTSGKIFALARLVDTVYKPEKVFFLDRDE